MPRKNSKTIEAKKTETVNLEKQFPLRVRLQTISTVDKILFIRHLEVLMRSGFSIADGLKTVAKQVDNTRFQAVVEGLARDVEAGTNLSTSMKRYPNVFSEIVVNIIEAGEESGEMSELLQRLAVHMKKTHALKSKVRGAMIYPSVVLVAMVAVSIVTITFVVPRMTTLFEASSAELPIPTQVLIVISDILIQQGVWLALGAIVLAIGFVQFVKNPKGRLAFDKFVLKLPLVGGIVKKTNIANFTRTLSSFLKTDIPIVRTFEVVSMTLGNHAYREVTFFASDQLRQGTAISTVLLKFPKLFPPMVTQIFVTGEETGTLESIITEIAEFYDADVEEVLGNLQTIIEPVLILFLGGGVAALALAVLLPLMSLSSVV